MHSYENDIFTPTQPLQIIQQIFVLICMYFCTNLFSTEWLHGLIVMKNFVMVGALWRVDSVYEDSFCLTFTFGVVDGQIVVFLTRLTISLSVLYVVHMLLFIDKY